ncbi:unnamed protein product [Prunus armeniaca]
MGESVLCSWVKEDYAMLPKMPRQGNKGEVGFELLKQHNQHAFEGKLIQEIREELLEIAKNFVDLLNPLDFWIEMFNVTAKVLWTTYLNGGYLWAFFTKRLEFEDKFFPT